jgi:hypothetical protein
VLGGWLLWQLWGMGGTTEVIAHRDLIAVPWPSELDFAGERVPLDDFYVRELWEKEFLVALSADYQNILYLKRAPKYFPVIEAELARRGLPDDLKYLAVAESALKPRAASGAGAAGIWQFIPATGQRYGLTVTEEVDERQHFAKATAAALDYLTDLHDRFDSWTLAAAAYNMGENGLERRLAEQGVSSYYDLYLNAETASYLFRILAIKQIMQHPEEYGYTLRLADYFVEPTTRTVQTAGIPDLAAFARTQGTNLRTLLELNPWLTGDSLPPGEWELFIPTE